MNMHINQEHFWAGYEAGWERAEEAGKGQVGDPLGADDDYVLGYWNGVGQCQAWESGWHAAECGILFCPYSVGAEDECFREAWLKGHLCCMEWRANTNNPSEAKH